MRIQPRPVLEPPRRHGVAQHAPGAVEQDGRHHGGDGPEHGRDRDLQALANRPGQREPEAGGDDDRHHQQQEAPTIAAKLRIDVLGSAAEAACQPAHSPGEATEHGTDALEDRRAQSGALRFRLGAAARGREDDEERAGAFVAGLVERAAPEELLERDWLLEFREGEVARDAMPSTVADIAPLTDFTHRGGGDFGLLAA